MDPTTTPPALPVTEPPAPPAVPSPGAVDIVAQIAQRIAGSKNVLVTVGTDPSVDELASALGLTLLLGKLDKHVTAVFSGATPPAIEFLDPEATFEDTVDSLRDFIIALDKEKADKLRYKVEEDVVRIFITPYKTVISEKDLRFSQGDFNVDVVVALGVQKQEELDKAITAHGRILHDATVITINSGGGASNLGAIDWLGSDASSIAEMIVNLSPSLGPDLLDAQISTALLTGIVAETNRFSNEKTNPKVMNTAAQLMAAGANQQLIASNLRQEGMLSEPVRSKASAASDDNGEMVLEHNKPAVDEKPVDSKNDATKKPTPKKSSTPVPEATKLTIESKPSDTTGNITTDAGQEQQSPSQISSTSDVPSDDTSKNSNTEAAISSQSDSVSTSALDSASSAANTLPTVLPAVADVKSAPIEPTSSASDSSMPPLPPLPSLDGSSPSPAPKSPQEDSDAASAPRPQIIPSHPPQAPAEAPTFGGTLNSTAPDTEPPALDALGDKPDGSLLEHHSAEAVDAARQAVADATSGAPFNPANQPTEALNATNVTLDPPKSKAAPTLPPLPATQSVSAVAKEPSPIDAFMQPYAAPTPLNGMADISASADVPSAGDLPPLPPLPNIPTSDGLPPMPPLPGQPIDPAAAFQPQINPGFMQQTPQSQNHWTDAGEDMATKQAQSDADRQAKIDNRVADYESAVDRNQELQGKPPLNNTQNPFSRP